jgi:hypothetical protein
MPILLTNDWPGKRAHLPIIPMDSKLGGAILAPEKQAETNKPAVRKLPIAVQVPG